ncbi:WG repeat-containing protein [Porphyromonas pogonae]|uniref:WG repeat-containing protein n=1 Tax=Porphyromonas pogonae TaxID=867595 RepID=UPI002E77FBC7|nr:WG repeat-containing protein [Porphyromonas pogonae]
MYKKRIVTTVITLKFIALYALISVFNSCGSGNGKKLFQIEHNNLYGYINEKSDTVVQCNYLFSYTDTIKTIGFVMNQNNRIICLNNKGEEVFETFNYDNGPDYPREGCFRIIGKNGLMGFADTLGNVVVEPVYKFAYPFEGGKAKVTFTGQLKSDSASNGEYHYWESAINNPLRKK